MQRLAVTEELRTMMRGVVAKLDWGKDYHGERATGGLYRFAVGGLTILLREQQIRDIADGHLVEIDAVETEPAGQPLVVWGEYDDDALAITGDRALRVALDALAASGGLEPLVVRLWSAGDEQVLCVMDGADCAIYAVRGCYGTSVGERTRAGTFTVVDHVLGELAIPWAACLPWPVVRPALLAFATRGELPDIVLDGALPGPLVVVGDLDRKAELATRSAPATDPALTSLVRKGPHGEWARRLLRGLVDLHLLDIDPAMLDALVARTAMLLVEMGEEAQDNGGRAQQLASEIAAMRGVSGMFATPGDLQIALRRTQDPPTMPVEMPFKH